MNIKCLFLASVLIAACSCQADAQNDTTYLYTNRNFQPVEKVRARYYRVIWKDGERYAVRDYYAGTRDLRQTGAYTDEGLTVESGTFATYKPGNIIESKGVYQEGKRDGLWTSYYKGGRLKDSIFYKEGKPWTFSYAWHEDGTVKEATILDAGNGYSISYNPKGKVFERGKYSDGDRDSTWEFFDTKGSELAVVSYKKGVISDLKCNEKAVGTDIMNCMAQAIPQFPGGQSVLQQYLAANLRWPEGAESRLPRRYNGKVVVKFIVNEDGHLSNFSISKSADPELDQEALRVVKSMPPWEHGRFQASQFKAYYTLPISFTR